MLYPERCKIEIVDTCKKIYCGDVKCMPIDKQGTPRCTKDHRGQHIFMSDL